MQENAKYCVILVFESVIPLLLTGLLGFKNFESLVFDDFLSKTQKVGVFLLTLYNKGQVSVTTLIDAQNAGLSAEINASHSLYQFLTDLFALERSTGTYYSLATREQRTEFLSNFMNFALNDNQ